MNLSPRISIESAMYRANSFFEQQGFIVIVYIVEYKTSKIWNNNFLNFLPIADNLKITENWIKEIIGWLFYTYRG